MTDDDPALDLRLRRGTEMRVYRIAPMHSGRAWCILGGHPFQISATTEREQAMAARRAFDADIAALLAADWIPDENPIGPIGVALKPPSHELLKTVGMFCAAMDALAWELPAVDASGWLTKAYRTFRHRAKKAGLI